MSVMQINGVRMNYIDEGTGAGIIFVHGLGESALSWRNQTDYFKAKYRVIAMDLRGHGASRGGEAEITMEQFAADIIALLDALMIDKAHFVGLSMGGLVCQELTRTAQERMLSLSLCNTAAFVGGGAAGKLPERLEMIERISMDAMADFIVRACMPYDFAQSVYDEAFNIFRQNRKEPYKLATTATFSVDFRDCLKSVRVPTCVVVGERDQSTPVSAAQFINENIKGSKLEILPGVGHLSKLENPQLFNSTIERFLNNIIV
ncbi:MAG: alpha/beta fold hydrolase [Negativicutes bacterium]|jgi:pimeloyl-ACP methyl ester carboxylesterase